MSIGRSESHNDVVNAELGEEIVEADGRKQSIDSKSSAIADPQLASAEASAIKLKSAQEIPDAQDGERNNVETTAEAVTNESLQQESDPVAESLDSAGTTAAEAVAQQQSESASAAATVRTKRENI